MDRRQFLGSVLASSVVTGLAVCVPESAFAGGAVDATPAVALAKAGTAHRASVTDFGADPTGREDATPAVRRAIASLAKSSARLVFPLGRYTFAAADGVAMAFDSYDGLEVFGNGAELLFSGDTQPLRITRSKHVEIHDLKLDWARPPFSQGTVIEAQPRSVTVVVDSEYPLTGAEAVEAFTEYDAKTGLPAAHGVSEEGSVRAVRLAAPQHLQLLLSRDTSAREGMRLVLLHRLAGNACINMQGCDMVLLESVALYAGAGAGALLEGCRDVSLEDVSIGVRPGSRRLLSVNGPGVQMVDCQGAVGIKRSGFRGMAGDGVEIHQSYWKIRSRSDERSVVIEGVGQRALEAWQIPDPGSILQLSDGTQLTLLGEIGLAKGENTSGGTKLTFKETLSPLIVSGTLVCNALGQPRTTIDHCTFGGNGGDGVVAHGRVHIANSRFAGCGGAGVRMAADLGAMKGPTVQSVTLADNSFDSCDYAQGGAQQGTITVGALRRKAGPANQPRMNEERVNQGITIQRNTFSNDGGAAIQCAAASWVTIEGNMIGRTGVQAPAGTTAQAIVLRNVDQSFLEMNQSKTQQNIVLVGCTEKVQMTANVLLSEVREA